MVSVPGIAILAAMSYCGRGKSRGWIGMALCTSSPEYIQWNRDGRVELLVYFV